MQLEQQGQADLPEQLGLQGHPGPLDLLALPELLVRQVQAVRAAQQVRRE